MVSSSSRRGNTCAAPADAVQFVRGDPSTVTVGSTYTLPPHNEPHVVLLIVDEGGCVVLHLAPLGSRPSGSAVTVKKGMNWFASSASPVKLTDEERVRADAARERFTQGEQRIESRRQEVEQILSSCFSPCHVTQSCHKKDEQAKFSHQAVDTAVRRSRHTQFTPICPPPWHQPITKVFRAGNQ